MITVTYISNQGSGESREIEVASGTTLASFILDRVGGGAEDDYTIRLNREEVSLTDNHVLRNGDRVTVSPTKVDGATNNR